MGLTDRIREAYRAWPAQHGGAFPARIYLSPAATVRVLRASCGTSAVRPELVAHGDTGGQLWTVKRFAMDVLAMAWFEDTRMDGEAFRFEA